MFGLFTKTVFSGFRPDSTQTGLLSPDGLYVYSETNCIYFMYMEVKEQQRRL